MQLITPFDASQFDPTQGVSQLPVGKHPVICFASEVKANKANDGGFLQLSLRIIDGPCSGQTGAYRLNLYSSNQQAVEIANKSFSALCHVLGQFKITDSSQLHDIPFVIDVEPQKNDPSYTEVKRVYDINGNEPNRAGAGAPAAQPQQTQPAAQPAASSWGGQPQGQQQPAAQSQPAANGWGQPAATSQPVATEQPAATGWGGQQPQQPQQTSQPAATGWGGQQQGQQGQAAAAPWGQR